MKKKLLIGTFIPLIAAFAVIGSGFSLWIFDDSNSVDISSNVSITTIDALTAGNILVYGDSKTNLNKGTYINFDQSTFDSEGKVIKTGISFKNHTGDYRTGAYYLWDYSSNLINNINGNSNDFIRKGNLEVKSISETPYKNLGTDTDIIFTTVLALPVELGKYFTLSYKNYSFIETSEIELNSNDDRVEQEIDIPAGKMKVSYGKWNVKYTITEYLSKLEPTTENLLELFPRGKMSNAINHEFDETALGTGYSTMKAKFGYNFFDWANMDISYYTGSDDKWHVKEPSSLSEYKTMLNSLSNIEGKSDNEQANGNCAIGVTYNAEVVIL